MGLGSMGTRRVRDLLAEGVEVVGADPREHRRAAAAARFGISVTVEASDLPDVDGIVVSTPPDLHVPLYEWAFRKGRSFFSEANLLTPRPSWFERAARTGARGFPSGTWRFSAPLAAAVAGLRVGGHGETIRHSFGSDVATWHPDETAETYYALRSATAAAREMVPFEMEWVVACAGPAASVRASRRARQPRKANGRLPYDEGFDLKIDFVSGAHGTLRVDLDAVKPIRETVVEGPNGRCALDLLVPRRGAVATIEEAYRAEIRAFLDALRGARPYPKSWEDDRHLSDILFAAAMSDREERPITLVEARAAYEGLSPAELPPARA